MVDIANAHLAKQKLSRLIQTRVKFAFKHITQLATLMTLVLTPLLPQPVLADVQYVPDSYLFTVNRDLSVNLDPSAALWRFSVVLTDQNGNQNRNIFFITFEDPSQGGCADRFGPFNLPIQHYECWVWSSQGNSVPGVRLHVTPRGNSLGPGHVYWYQSLLARGGLSNGVVPILEDPTNGFLATFSAFQDLAPPVVTAIPDRLPNANGWYKDSVDISWDAIDPEPSSGGPTVPENTLANVEGAHTYTSSPSCDGAGNCASGSTDISIDTVAPSVNVTGVVNSSTYRLDTLPVAGCATADATSGVGSHAAALTTGGNSNGTGTFSTVCSGAVDMAGNVGANPSAAYTVYFPLPTTKNSCKNGGWATLSDNNGVPFGSQGACVSFTNHN